MSDQPQDTGIGTTAQPTELPTPESQGAQAPGSPHQPSPLNQAPGNAARRAGKFGRKPSDDSRPAVRFASVLRQQLPIPSGFDAISAVPQWPMYDNDSIGDCGPVGCAHAIEGWTQYAQGAAIVLDRTAVLAAYEAVGGYDPSQTDANGNNPTDQGVVLQDLLEHWRNNGIGEHKIAYFARVDTSNLRELQAAIYYFGHLLYGFEVPASAVTQFETHQPWHVVDPDGGLLDGHAVNLGYYDPTTFRCVTWGAVQVIDPAFLSHYGQEAWVIITQDWLDLATALSPAGLDLAGLGAEIARVTGEPNPFPDEPPTPAPPAPAPDVPPAPEPPAPEPAPTPTVPPEDAALLDAMATWKTAKGY